MGLTSEKAGDWTLALALSLTDPGHVSLLGLSPGQSSGGNRVTSAVYHLLEPLVPLGCPGSLRWVGVPHISVTGPGEHGGGGVKMAPWENVAIEP